MLEPLYTCNLACLGCAIERHTGKLRTGSPLEKCLEAVDTSKAPDRLDLRRRADDLPGAARARLRDHPQKAPHLPLHQRASPRPEGVRRHPSRPPPDDQRAPGRHEGDARQGLRARGGLRQGRRDDPGRRCPGPPHDGQHDDLQGDRGLRGRRALHASDRPRRRGTARFPGLSLRVGSDRHLPYEVGDPEEVPAGAGDLEKVQADLDSDVPGVRGGPARLQAALPGAP